MCVFTGLPPASFLPPVRGRGCRRAGAQAALAGHEVGAPGWRAHSRAPFCRLETPGPCIRIMTMAVRTDSTKKGLVGNPDHCLV